MIRLAHALAVLGLVSPPLDGVLRASMAGHVLVQVPLLLLLGDRARGAVPARGADRLDPHGLASLAFAVGAVTFWMLPRSLDLAALSTPHALVMHATMLLAGLAWGLARQRLPFAVRGAVGILLTACLLAMGGFYASSTELVCGSYTLELQQEAGGAMLAAAPLLLAAVLWAMGRSLAALPATGRDAPGS